MEGVAKQVENPAKILSRLTAAFERQIPSMMQISQEHARFVE